MKRREFIGLVGGAAATWPLAARAQQGIRRIGVQLAFAKELVGLQPDLIVGSTTPATAALQRETRTIPIVFVVVSDPVGSGIVVSLPHPGGNITGFINIEASLSGKWIEMLKDIMPRVTRATLMFNSETAPYFAYYLQPFEAAAPRRPHRSVI